MDIYIDRVCHVHQLTFWLSVCGWVCICAGFSILQGCLREKVYRQQLTYNTLPSKTNWVQWHFWDFSFGDYLNIEADNWLLFKTIGPPQKMDLPRLNMKNLYPFCWEVRGFTLPEIGGWKMNFLLGPSLFSGAFAVSFRERYTLFFWGVLIWRVAFSQAVHPSMTVVPMELKWPRFRPSWHAC